jgi:hypothetical protein
MYPCLWIPNLPIFLWMVALERWINFLLTNYPTNSIGLSFFFFSRFVSTIYRIKLILAFICLPFNWIDHLSVELKMDFKDTSSLQWTKTIGSSKVVVLLLFFPGFAALIVAIENKVITLLSDIGYSFNGNVCWRFRVCTEPTDICLSEAFLRT